jgi:hypothetical protein
MHAPCQDGAQEVGLGFVRGGGHGISLEIED